jgi:putative nucleotidyltransferase with HDIG domain
VVEVLEQEPILAGRVLRLVQSPLYAGLVPIKSLKQAVVRLGLETLREVVMTVALDMRVFKASIYRDVMVQLQQHSRATGYLAKVICRYTGVDSEFAFLCGLLHDVGIAGMLIILSEKRSKNSMPALAPLWPNIEAAHDTASGLMAQIWGMPDEIARVLGSHHTLIGAKSVDPMIATIRLAECIADEQGFGISIPGQPPTGPIDGNHRPTLESSVQYLGVNEKTMELIRKDAHLVLKTLVA